MSDLEIAKQIELKHIKTIAAKIGLEEDDVDMFGKTFNIYIPYLLKAERNWTAAVSFEEYERYYGYSFYIMKTV